VRRPGGPAGIRPRILLGIVVIWTLLAFLPVIPNDFVNWDDYRMFLDNPTHRGSWADRFRGAWASHRLGEYMPVTWMSYALDRSLWDVDASGYHLTSLLLHAVGALLVFALAWRLLRLALGPTSAATNDTGWSLGVGAMVAALVFALHPLRVEAVAWVSARGTVLGGVLLVLSVLVYTAGWERGRAASRVPGAWLLGAALLFAASLLARATGLVLPAVLVALDVYPFRRLGGGPGGWLGPATRRVWLEKLPFAAIALLAVPMGFLARGDEVGDFWRFEYDLPMALSWSVYSAAFYVWKTLAPVALGPLYPMPERGEPMLAVVLLSAGLVAGITAGLWTFRRRWPGALTAWVVYLVLLAPLSGILPFGRLRGVADRYTYAACIGWAVVAGGAAALGWRTLERGRGSRLWASAVGATVLAVLLGWSVLTWQQATVWRDGVTLWSWALGMVPDSPVAHNNLAWVLAHAGELERAEMHARRAVRAWPNQPAVLQTLSRILVARGQLDEAATVLRHLVVVAPNSAEVRADLGSVLFQQGAADPAVRELRHAIALDPDAARAHEYLGRALSAEGRQEEAETHLRRAAELRGEPWAPTDAAAPTPPAPRPPVRPVAPPASGTRPRSTGIPGRGVGLRRAGAPARVGGS
jgi:hypothetical protein